MTDFNNEEEQPKVFVYSRAPIDFWPGWMSEDQFFQSLSGVFFGDDTTGRDEYEKFRARAFELARKVGWEGDIREGPYVAGLPEKGVDSYAFIVAWKQDNNGETFVASPYELPWLRDGDNVAVDSARS